MEGRGLFITLEGGEGAGKTTLAARLAEAFRARAKDRRYTQAFRERHYDFLRRYVELKIKIDRALGETPPGE